MKHKIKAIVEKFINTLSDQISERLFSKVGMQFTQHTRVNNGVQILLTLKYRENLVSNGKLPTFDEVEFRLYSQNGEDGILLYIFSLLGTTNKKVVEICAGYGMQCNSANLIINHGWIGLLFDGNKNNVEKGIEFYKHHPDTFNWPPKFVRSWITAENINSLIKDNGFEGEIDLLSIDIDGMDYWLWKAIDVISPRVVVVEYQDILGPDRSVTVPYSPNFVAEFTELGPNYCGASLKAFTKLAKEKGYRLVGCQRYGYNAFFIKNDIGKNIFPEIPIDDCFTHPKVINGIKARFPLVKDKEWIEV